MSFRLFIHIPKGTIKLLLYTAVGLGVLFLALTRTQVGRDGLRAQIERQFNSTFEGRLTIGRLQGNLLNTLYAQNIELTDTTGFVVASVDAAVLQPTWYEFLSGNISLQRITLIQPRFNILRHADSTWNINGVLKRRQINPNTPLPAAFTSSNIKIMNGTLRATNLGAVPGDIAQGKIFNYTEAALSQIYAQMNVEWRENGRLLDIDQLSFRLDNENIELADLHGQIRVADDRLEFNEVFLTSEETWMELSGFVDQPAAFKTNPAQTALDLDIRASRLDGNSLRRLFPALPLEDTLRIASRVTGSLDALDIQSLAINRGELSINGNGYVRGYPDSLAFIAFLSESNFSQEDLQIAFPDVSFAPVSAQFSPLIHTLQARGSIQLGPRGIQPPHYGKVSFDIENHGSLAGNLEFARDDQDSLYTFTAFLDADSVNLATILPQFDTPTRLNGTLAVQGAGTSPTNAISDIQLRLRPSSVANVAFDTLEASTFFEDGSFDIQALAQDSRHGSVGAIARYDLTQPAHVLRADIRTNGLNIGSLIQHDSLSSSLDAHIRVNSRGASLQQVRGNIDIDINPSELALGNLQQQVPAHSIGLAFEDVSDSLQVLTLDGDIAHATLKGQYNLADFFQLGKDWDALVSQTFSELIFKSTAQSNVPDSLQNELIVSDSLYFVPPYHDINLTQEATASATPTQNTAADPDYRPTTAHADSLIADSLTTGPQTFELTLAFRQPALLRSWMPASPYLSTDASGTFVITSGPSSLALHGQLQADSLIVNDMKLAHLDGDLGFTSDLLKPAEKRLTFNSHLQADSLTMFGQLLPFPIFDVSLEEGAGTLGLTTKSSQRLGPQRIRTSIEVFPSFNRIRFEELFLSIGNSSWTTYEPAHVDITGQTISIPDLELQSRSPEANILQSIRLSGVLSPNPSDTAAIDINNIAIRPVSQFMGMPTPLGGLISGKLAFTTTNDQPELTGTINVDRFSLDNRVLGDINIASRYLPGQPDVGLRIALSPIAGFNQEAYLPDAEIPAVYENNELTIDGTFRLPRFNKQATGFLDAGELDLDLDLRRADVFFFEYIFPNFLSRADGYLTGTGKISGDFDVPVLDASIDLRGGEAEIPRFNLLYTDFSGDLTIDKDKIRLENGVFQDATGGVAEFSGDFLFNDYRYFSFDLAGNLDELLIMNQDYLDDLPFYGQIWASGSLTLTGPAFNALLISNDAVTKASSELFIPVTESEVDSDAGFLIFADSTGNIPDINQLGKRKNIFKRPDGERKFVEGLSLDLNILAPSGSTIHLVFDPLLGDAMNAVSSGRIQIQRSEGEFRTFGTLNVESGDYLFTAGDVFARRFFIDSGGTIVWDGDPIDARLDIPASYRTRASVAGLPENAFSGDHIPLVVQLDISGRVSSPEVDLNLRADRSDRSYRGNYEAIEAILNQTERLTDYATSVMLTNSFLLTTESATNTSNLTNSGNQIAFTSVSQLVASQLNRFLGEALPNVDLNLGLQGESLEDPEVTYGVALYLLDQRLVIRGQGVYQNEITSNQPDLEGEFEVEIRLSPSVSVSVFLRREGDLLAENALTSTRGAGLSYHTQFSSWQRLFDRIFGWMGKKKKTTDESPDVVAEQQE